MIYTLVVYRFDSGLNEVLNGRYYQPKFRTYRNDVKRTNDTICIDAIRQSKELRTVTFEKPIVIHYKFYAKDKKRDRMNIASAFDKSFQDALQKTYKLKNDGWNDVINCTFDFDVDKSRPRILVAIEEIDTTDYKVFDWSAIEGLDSLPKG